MLIQKNTFNVLSSSSPFEKRAQQCLPRFLWRGRHFGTCKSLGSSPVKMSQAFSTTLRSASTFYTFTGRLTGLKLLKCAFTRTFEPDVLPLFLRDLFIILSRFSCWILFSENVTGIPEPFDQLPSRMRKVNTFKTPEVRHYFDSDI